MGVVQARQPAPRLGSTCTLRHEASVMTGAIMKMVVSLDGGSLA
jgi:hypothetical protein